MVGIAHNSLLDCGHECVCVSGCLVCVCINTAGYKKIIMCSRNIANNGAIIFHFLLYCWAGGAYPEVKELFQGCSPAAPGWSI